MALFGQKMGCFAEGLGFSVASPSVASHPQGIRRAVLMGDAGGILEEQRRVRLVAIGQFAAVEDGSLDP
jgi:hypothetical protein